MQPHNDNLFRLNSAELAQMLRDVRCECVRRTTAETADACSIIKGHEMAKRAVLVAAAGNHSLLLVGCSGTGKTMLRAMAAELGLHETFEVWMCKCGRFSDINCDCTCTTRQIIAVRNKWPQCEITIEVPRVLEREMHSNLRGTSLEDLRQQLQQRTSGTSLVLGESEKRLLAAAVNDKGLDGHSRDSIVRVARTIANLDGSKAIGLPHLCEAINYRPLREG
jgi:predicted ATPase with chaperone activity